MPDGKFIATDQDIDIRSLLKSGGAFQFVAPFDRSKAYTQKAAGTDTEQLYVELLASSDGEDLVGDVMSLSALQDMESTAVGTLMLRDHNPSTEKIFGSIVEARLTKEGGRNYLWIKAHVDDGDPQNVRLFNLISRGSKLGASVTVIVDKTAPNPNKKSGGLYITGVKLLEISIVTIPCNQDAWTLAAAASKALRRSTQNQPKEVEETMDETNTPAQTQASKAQMPRTTAVIDRIKAYMALDDEARKAFEVPVTVVKGMFQDMVDHPDFYDLVDILREVRWSLQWEAYVATTNGSDTTEIVAKWSEALDEFKAACVDSFVFWEELGPDDDELDEISMSLEDADAIQKAFNELAGVIEKTQPETHDALRSIGTQMLETAAKAGIPLPVAKEGVSAVASDAPAEGDDAPEASITVTVDAAAAKAEVEKTLGTITELTERAETAEEELANLRLELADTQKDLGKTREELSIAKAGLDAADAALKTYLRRPLQVGPKTVATSS